MEKDARLFERAEARNYDAKEGEEEGKLKFARQTSDSLRRK
jgi:hypothetical protein